MKRVFLNVALAGLMALGLASSAQAQDAADAQAKFQASYEAKVAESWFVDNGFTDDYDKARQLAASTGRPIFAYFTRSYSP